MLKFLTSSNAILCCLLCGFLIFSAEFFRQTLTHHHKLGAELNSMARISTIAYISIR